MPLPPIKKLIVALIPHTHQRCTPSVGVRAYSRPFGFSLCLHDSIPQMVATRDVTRCMWVTVAGGLGVRLQKGLTAKFQLKDFCNFRAVSYLPVLRTATVTHIHRSAFLDAV